MTLMSFVPAIVGIVVFGIICLVNYSLSPVRTVDNDSEADILVIKQESFNDGKKSAMADLEKIKATAFEEGKDFMKNRFVVFMEETVLMVKNDEMEMIEVVPTDLTS